MSIESELLVQGFAAFAGAFFAYFFTRVADFFGRVYQRQIKHFNSLVKLEQQLNEIGGIIDDNLYVIPPFRSVLESGNVYYNNLHIIKVDQTHFDDLHDVDLLNSLFVYQYEVRRNNDDISTFTNGLHMLTSALMNKGITHDEYKVNALLLAEQMRTIEAFHKRLQDNTIQLLSRVRVQIKMDVPLGTKLQRLFIHTAGDTGKITKKMVKDERKKLEKELKKSRAESRKEIEQIRKENNLS